MSPAADNIWDAAIAWQRQRQSDPGGAAADGVAGVPSSSASAETTETTLLVVGSKNVGKTTLIHRLLERQEVPKPTLALEYTFGRKKNQNLAKDVCHIWELGGGTLFANLLETPMSPAKLPSLHVILMVDLSEPHHLWFTLETLMSALQGQVQRAMKAAEAKEGAGLKDRLTKLSNERNDKDHPDLQKMHPFQLPLVIVGGKYDMFQDTDPEKKKIICRALRFFAHYHGASLQFYSAKDSGLVKKARDTLSYHAFGTDAGKGVSQDYNKPLIIPAWSDSFQAITGGDESGNLDVMKHHFTTHFPQTVDERTALGDDPSQDPNFREPEIDQLRRQKDEDLERYRKDIERRAKQWDDFDQSVKY